MDLIERELATEWIYNWRDKNKYYHPFSKNKTIPISEVIDILESVPSAEKTGKWTLFKDKVPPETGRYFITLDLGYAKNLVTNDVWISIDCEWSVYDNEDVIAWMPIEYPEQYKEGD